MYTETFDHGGGTSESSNPPEVEVVNESRNSSGGSEREMIDVDITRGEICENLNGSKSLSSLVSTSRKGVQVYTETFDHGSGTSESSNPPEEVHESRNSSGPEREMTDVDITRGEICENLNGTESLSSLVSTSRKCVQMYTETFDHGGGTSESSNPPEVVNESRNSSGPEREMTDVDITRGEICENLNGTKSLSSLVSTSRNCVQMYTETFDHGGGTSESSNPPEVVNESRNSSSSEREMIDVDITSGEICENLNGTKSLSSLVSTSRNCVEMYTETFDHGGGTSESSNPPEVVNESRNSSSSEREMIDVDITSGEICENLNGTKSLSSLVSTSRTSSSSESSSTSEDLFPLNSLTLNFTASQDTSVVPASKSAENYVSKSESSAKSEVNNSLPVLPPPTYQVYNLAYNQTVSPIMSPPIQVMERSGRYEPPRIPASVFERSTNPLEWSIASNDSLFSLHIGPNNSFSRQHTFRFSDIGTCTAEELTKSDGLNMFNSRPSLTIEEIEIARKSVEVLDHLQTIEKTDEAAFKVEQNPSDKDRYELKTLHQAASSKSSKTSMSSLSQERITPQYSFVPLKKRSRSCCYCFNCSWGFCYPTWSSCNGSCCSWVFCCCSHTKSNHNASPILSEAEMNSFVKPGNPQQQPYIQDSASCCYCCFPSKHASELTSNSSSSCFHWFHCFSCPSCCTGKFSFFCPRYKCCC